jgi:WD40 repeat protein
MRWRVSGRVYEGPAEVNALAWSPVTRAGEPETIALALGADVGLFRVDGRALMDDGSSGAGVESPRAALDATLHHPARVVGLDWNSVGNTLATSAEDGRVRLWSANALDGTWETQAQLVGE